MKVLFTGMASAHCKQPTETTNKTFFTVFSGLFNEIAPSADVVWQTPSLSWTKEYLDQFDLIFVGIIPPTALSANKVYGALSAIELMYESPKLHLILDSAQLWQYETGFAAIARDPGYITGGFFSKRFENKLATSPEALTRLKSVSDKFLLQQWPKTIYPKLPWKSDEAVEVHLPNARGSLVGVNLDAYLLNEEFVVAHGGRYGWAIDSTSTKWSKSIDKVTRLPATKMKKTLRASDDEVYDTLRDSIGTLISPQDRGVGTWWSYRYIQAMNATSPIVTEWKESSKLSHHWAHLAYQIEDMSEAERFNVAAKQVDTYYDAIPTKQDITDQFKVVFNV